MRKPTVDEANALQDEGLLRVSEFLYVLRNEAGKAAEELGYEINRMNEALTKANRVHARLAYIAHTAERAAEREMEAPDA